MEYDVIRGLWVARQGGVARKEKEAAMVLHQSEGLGHHHSYPRGSQEA